MTTFSTTQLDFDQIKENLKTYLRRNPEFADYDFEASGLSNVLDVLAYNTHYNGLLANFALNEAYLSSAQLRSSVITIAQSLGYNVRSRRASTAYVNLSLNLSAAPIKPSTITLPANTKFTTSVDGVSYTFQTREAYIASNNSGIYTFETASGATAIPIYEGTSRKKTFIVQSEDERQIFVIPDETIDTSQMVVKVYDSYGSTSYTAYTNIDGVTSISAESTHYRIQESPNGYYEVSFGDGSTTGQKPTVGNKVEIEYLSTSGPDANSAASFSSVSQVTVNSTNYDLTVSVSSVSSGGALRQSIESIRENAPLGFASQNRLVTAEDYKTIILSKYSSVIDAVAWGGEDNVPADYGKVFIGLLFGTGISTSAQTEIKNDITAVLNENLAILSIDVEFVDPVTVYLQIETDFYFNPNLTGLTQSTVEGQVLSVIENYVENNLQTFGGIFRKSNLAAEIDVVSDAVLSSKTTVKMVQRLTPITTATVDDASTATTYSITYPVQLAPPDDVNRVITSTAFSYNGVTCTVANALNSTKLQIIDGSGNVIVDNIGSYMPSTGKVLLEGFAPGVIASGDSYIKFIAVPLNDAVIKPLRNYYLDIDASTSYAAAVIDRQNTSISL